VTLFNPPGVSAQGQESVLAISAAVNIAAVTVAETVAVSTVMLNMAARGFNPSAEQGTSQDRRLGSKFVYESPGTAQWTVEEMVLIARPQDAAAAATAKHRDTLIEGWVGWFLDRRGFSSNPENWVAFTTGHRYKAYPVLAGPQVDRGIDPGADGGQFEYGQRFYITGPVVPGVVA
jgi:hypothetical protein